MRLIDADALIKDIDYSADMGGALGKVVECVKYYAKYMVASAPTIEPERKKGEWVKLKSRGRGYKCDQCGNLLDFSGVNAGRGDANFCPNCGADMGGEYNGN